MLLSHLEKHLSAALREKWIVSLINNWPARQFIIIASTFGERGPFDGTLVESLSRARSVSKMEIQLPTHMPIISCPIAFISRC